ncbi:hypothetical protein MPTK1_1g20290 [Marchantia polymorpha subsp. ruderalis]|uniref:Uncharacterized protein n=2 Tax=Marchantia polymorpha TaxID=3197 RepID=A0AAF6AS78_MARPO|nr:hypothetical protein MARPO_0001s0366 [Marchantia polymorpha]BBM99298.1 hypothetical protein Mp_1g20290 [Marchantia polymorpha subsp. ruderalis]|eukprot:PTQ50380.1 hypothetical protein MARPO_0001s0366 [Marchantia polymorpha]
MVGERGTEINNSKRSLHATSSTQLHIILDSDFSKSEYSNCEWLKDVYEADSSKKSTLALTRSMDSIDTCGCNTEWKVKYLVRFKFTSSIHDTSWINCTVIFPYEKLVRKST